MDDEDGLLGRCHDTTPLGKQPHVLEIPPPPPTTATKQKHHIMATMQGLTDEFQVLQKGAKPPRQCWRVDKDEEEEEGC